VISASCRSSTLTKYSVSVTQKEKSTDSLRKITSHQLSVLSGAERAHLNPAKHAALLIVCRPAPTLCIQFSTLDADFGFLPLKGDTTA